MEGKLFVLGNLLLDVIAPLDNSFLEQYGLKPDSIQTLDSVVHSNICDEVLKKSKNVTLAPGGSALNTVRMAQSILKVPNIITLVGAVGDDETGQILISTVEKEGIIMLPQVIENCNTGKCISLLTSGGTARTMLTDMGAALKFSYESFINNDRAMECLEKAGYVYISGYFLKVCPSTVMHVAKQAKGRNLPVLLNLNAVWLTIACKNELIHLLPFTDVIFGNESEIVSFSKQIGQEFDLLETIANGLSIFGGTKRIVISTRGEKPVISSMYGVVTEYQVAVLPPNEIVDTTGAGDAFVGGFLSKYVYGKTIEECIQCGIWAAGEELKGYGFILPQT